MPRSRKVAALADGSARPWLTSACRWAGQFLLPLLLGLGLLVGVLALGRWATGALSGAPRRLPFLAIACQPPPGMDREAFLGEVQYLADLPDEVDLLDGTLAPKLAGAFSLHPWVARVQRVEKGPDRLTVLLVHRVPALAVRLPGQREAFRAVDEDGVLLPAGATHAALPYLREAKHLPAVRPGSVWDDEEVRAAARTVSFLAGQSATPGLAGCAITVKDGKVALRFKGRQIVWGRPPGEELPGEPPAQAKLAAMVDRGEGDLDLSRR